MASMLRSVLPALPLALACGLMGGLAFLPSPVLGAECPVPEESFLFEPALPRFVQALSAGKPVTIVAVGGASTEGRAAGGPDHAWPSRLGAALKAKYPAVSFTVVNLGKARQTAAAMYDRFETDVIPRAPALVIWETGTVDAVRGVDLDIFREVLQEGLARLYPVADVALMDMQFSRRTSAMIDFEPYERALKLIADVNDVPVFPRNDLMREWSESGDLDFAVRGKEKRIALARALYGCIGKALADFVTREPTEGTAGR